MCFDILYTAFYNWPADMFNILNSSIEISNYIIANIHFLPVSNFVKNLVNFSIQSQPFAWLLYRCLMGQFGAGGPTPSSILNDVISTCKEPLISSQQRIPILYILNCLFFKYKRETTDFSKAICFALPVLLQRAASSQERCLILELSLKLPKNEAIMKCCDSILFSDCKDRKMIELSFQYLTLYPPQPNPNELEILIYDVLNRRTNNFIINSFIAFFRKQMSIFEMTKQFVERARNIIIYSMKSQKSSLLLRMARIEIVNAINGKEMMISPSFQIDDYAKEDIKRQRANICSSSYDTSRIKYLKDQIASNDRKAPVFDASTLWGAKATVNMSYFNNFNNRNKGQIQPSTLKSRIENAFESVEVNDDDDLLDENEKEDFFRQNNKRSFMESSNRSFSDLRSISSPNMIKGQSSNAGSIMKSSQKNSSLANSNQRKNAKINQTNSKEVFKSRQLASKKKTYSFLSTQRPKQEIRKSPPSNLKPAEKVEQKQLKQSIITTASSTSSLHLLRNDQINNIKMNFNNKPIVTNLVDNDYDDNDDEIYDENIQSWNAQSKNSQNENKSQVQITKQISFEKETTNLSPKPSKTPTKIRSSQSASITFKTKRVSATPQKRPFKSSQQNNSNLKKRSIVH